MSRGLWCVGIVACTHGPAPGPIAASNGAPPGPIDIVYHHAGFEGDHVTHYVLDWKPGEGYRYHGKVIDPRAVDAVWAALTDLRPSDGELECASHTDDYPSFAIVLGGAQHVELRSQSNCRDHIPWNVVKDGALQVQYTGAIGRAVEGLLAAVDPATWTAPVDEPAATMILGVGSVNLGVYAGGIETSVPEPGVRTAPSVAAACAHSIESSEPARAVFGQVVHVDVLTLACDLAISPDCQRATADVSLAWRGFSASFTVDCVAGAFDPGSLAATTVADVGRFIDSPPARALVRLAAKPPSLWQTDRTWNIDAGADLPGLEYTPPRAVISVRSVSETGPSGVRFWQALGIDAAKLTRPLPVTSQMYETTGELDLAGRLIE